MRYLCTPQSYSTHPYNILKPKTKQLPTFFRCHFHNVISWSFLKKICVSMEFVSKHSKLRISQRWWKDVAGGSQGRVNFFTFISLEKAWFILPCVTIFYDQKDVQYFCYFPFRRLEFNKKSVPSVTKSYMVHWSNVDNQKDTYLTITWSAQGSYGPKWCNQICICEQNMWLIAECLCLCSKHYRILLHITISVALSPTKNRYSNDDTSLKRPTVRVIEFSLHAKEIFKGMP